MSDTTTEPANGNGGNGNGNDKEEPSRADKLMEWAREVNVPFRGKEAADYLKVAPVNVGPTLRMLTRERKLFKGEEGGNTVYATTPFVDTSTPEFITSLKTSLEERLNFLVPFEQEAERVRKALDALK